MQFGVNAIIVLNSGLLSFQAVFCDTKLNEFRIFSDPSFTVVSITKLETEGPVWWTQNT